MHIEIRHPAGTKDIVVGLNDGTGFTELGSFPSPITALRLAEKTRRKTGFPIFHFPNDVVDVGPMKSMRFGP